MPVSQLPLTLDQPHQNHQLFADHYVNQTLPEHPQWDALLDDAQPVYAQIAAIVAAYTPSANEAQTERDLIQPVLAALGHTFEIQASLRTPKGVKRPDYVFYRDAATRAAHKDQVLDDAALAGQAYAVGDAKHWERRLDVSSRGEREEITRVPADQIAFYMRHSRMPWGLLTNGRHWRLYHRDTVEKQDRFYEVDLVALVEQGDVGAFRYFYAFFRRAAFEQPGGDTLTLAEMLQESSAYAQGISAALKQQVFDALRHLAQGFLDFPRNRLEPTPATLDAIYRHSLIVLYRLLFVLYAEARGLLPLRTNQAYRDTYSLAALNRATAQRLDRGQHLLADTGRTWASLRDLFAIINHGSPPLTVATFNGGLFDPQRHQFLEDYTVGDAQLQQALDKLARVDGAFIDYRDLAERHLGTIYEGLLEYHLQPLAAPEHGFTVDLFDDNGERHRTGSYYTPDFVVQYIVAQTVQPLLDAAVANATSDAATIQAVLALNILDPAMGSGHFPVAVTEYIARFLVERDVVPDDDVGDAADLVYWKRRVAQSCIYGVDRNPLAVDLAKLSLWLATAATDKPLSFLDHHLRCGDALVGARLADLDLSPTRQRSKRKAQQSQAAGQVSMLDDPAFASSMATAVDAMWLIERSAGNTVAEVKEQEQVYAQLRADLTRRYGRLADLATATRFGLAVDAQFWPTLADYATERIVAVPKQLEAWLDAAATAATERQFFHWELAFPEVFFDTHGQPLGAAGGFDAVVGNPPYVRQEQLGPVKDYFRQAFADVYSGTADVFVYFFRQGIHLLRHNGMLAYIASNSWLRANYATAFRAFLRTDVTVEQLIDLGDNRVFADAPDVYPAIPLVRNAAPLAGHAAQSATFNRGEGLNDFAAQVAVKLTPVTIHDQQDSGWQLDADAERKAFAKLMAQGRPLGEAVEGRIYRGVLTGLNEAFIIDGATRARLVTADPTSAAIIKPLARGEDLRPWYQEDENRFLIFARRGIDIEAYPAIKAYLIQFRTQLEPKPADWSGARWNGRKAGNYKWYEIQDSVDYYAAFDTPKIFWPDIAKFPRFSWDETGCYPNDKGAIVVPDDPYVLGVLQSRAGWFCVSNLCVPLGERAGAIRYQQKLQFISRLPIPDAPEAERDAIGALAMQITAEAKARYALHRRAHNRIVSDLGAAGGKLNKKLTRWWELPFPAFRSEVNKAFKRDIPLAERDDWEEWLAAQTAKHATHTAAIVAGETALNALVYASFNLSADEIAVIEASTKYEYGEV